MEIRGLGTLVNVLCILLGGLVGYLAGNRLREPVRETLMALMGVGVMVLGLAGTLAEMLTMQDGKLVSGGTIMLIVSLGAGGVIGEALRLEDQVLRFGTWLKVKSRSSGDSTFVEGFVTASCTVCIGAMAVIGSIQDGIWGDWSVLAAKGVIDAILVCVMAAAQGKGCIFSAIPVGLLQGGLTAVAFLAGDFLPQRSLAHLSLVGSVLIFCVGLNLIREKQIRVANALPAVLIAILWGFFA